MLGRSWRSATWIAVASAALVTWSCSTKTPMGHGEKFDNLAYPYPGASAVAGRMHAARRGAEEGLYVTPAGRVTEGTSTNVFVVERGAIVTPPCDGSILPGVTRALVVALARRARIDVREEPLTPTRVRRAREVFLTASTIEIVPVVRLDGRPIGDARPGPVTRTLQAGYAARVQRGNSTSGR